MILRVRASIQNRGGELALGDGGALGDAYVTMQRDGQMREAYGLQHGQVDRAMDVIASVVLPVRLLGADVEVGNVSRPRPAYGEGESREEGSGGGLLVDRGTV